MQHDPPQPPSRLQTQGPFPRSDLMDWLAAGFFGEDLPVRPATGGDPAVFLQLGNLMKIWDMVDKGRAPPGFMPGRGGPVPATPPPAPAPEAAAAPLTPQGSALPQQQPGMGLAGLQHQPSGQMGLPPPSPTPLSAAPSADLGPVPPPVLGPGTQRANSLLETLLGKKLADSPGQSLAPPPPQQLQQHQLQHQQPGGPQAGAPEGSAGRPFTLDPPIALASAASGNLGAGAGLGGVGSFDR